MDDTEVKAIEERIERIAATNPEDLAKAETQGMLLRALNALAGAVRELNIQREFGYPTEPELPDEAGIDERIELLRLRYRLIEPFLEPESKRFLEAAAVPAHEAPARSSPTLPGPDLPKRPQGTIRGSNVSRLVPIQVRISKLQEVSLEQAKARTGRTVSQLLREALSAERIQGRRQWNRTDSDGQLTIKRWVRCEVATVRALQLVAIRERLTLSDVVRALIDEAIAA